MDIDISIKNASVEEIRHLMDKLFPNRRAPDDRETMLKNLDNLHCDKWSSEEKAALDGSRNEKDAILRYRTAFPNSGRSIHAIRRMYQTTKNQKTDVTKPAVVLQQPGPVQVKEPEVKTKNGSHKEQPLTKLKRAVEGKYQIPFSSIGAGKNKYQQALYLCKKYKVPYPEALKLKEADEAKSRKPPIQSLENDFAKIILPDKKLSPVFNPNTPVPHFAVGDRVQCKEGHRELFEGVGIVKRINAANGNLLVSFLNGMDWVSPNHVELAPPGAKM